MKGRSLILLGLTALPELVAGGGPPPVPLCPIVVVIKHFDSIPIETLPPGKFTVENPQETVRRHFELMEEIRRLKEKGGFGLYDIELFFTLGAEDMDGFQFWFWENWFRLNQGRLSEALQKKFKERLAHLRMNGSFLDVLISRSRRSSSASRDESQAAWLSQTTLRHVFLVYRFVLGRNPTEQELVDYAVRYAKWEITLEEIAAALRKSREYEEKGGAEEELRRFLRP